MSASEFRIPYQRVSSSRPAENVAQFKVCRCGEGDTSETGKFSRPMINTLLVQVLKSGHLLLSSKAEDSSVIGRPAEFALVDADGSPSFLEKALKFIEDHGKNEFSPEEDAHVIGDCIKQHPKNGLQTHHVSFRTLKMMQIVESHKAVNRMSQSALAACMAPLLLRPLLLGECEIDNDFSMTGDGSFQLLQAAAAANHAQAIVIIMMEEFDQIFDARKDLSTEEIECCSDDETLIDKLENNKADLQSKIAKEAKENAILQASLERRKEGLRERRLALEKEVENLRDQLQKERNLKASLESGVMNLRRGQVSLPSTIDNKVSDLRGQVSGQQLCCESCNKRLLNTDRTGGPESSSVEASSTVASDSASDMVDVEQSRKQTTQHSSSSTDKPGQDAVGSINQRAPQIMQSVSREGQDGSSSASKWNFAQRQYANSPLIRGLHGSSNSHSSGRLEEFGGSAVPAASFALAKLTNRLNFLKERRALLASEMQSLDLGRPPAAAASGGGGAGAAPSVKSPTPKGPEKRS
ncbi:hypothetical protein BAE44_0024862 [Dichanthelium oligosanthes]|uniref:Ternary complex factor MIP1 leucine-zipper domain-containing protein n=1 Tax=Dichanthelium oligosanthes TaxID=888268 RepID=A0A1E5UML7_9POAL|nr:hypothetical protein BAE44_0024862 [Dichanthelium oligosanthes]